MDELITGGEGRGTEGGRRDAEGRIAAGAEGVKIKGRLKAPQCISFTYVRAVTPKK